MQHFRTDHGFQRAVAVHVGQCQRGHTEAAPVDALAVGDLDGDGTADYATASGNVVRVRSGLDASLLWASAPLGGPTVRVGEWDSLLLAEVDGRGQPELVVNFGSGFVVLTSAP